ncbi:MAG TPA: retroviral-like aspartic protease family protein [Stellaceae bacterium]|nr:retroviral-like aspartic protease family protein [Stellaceae bacterium]
MIQQVAEIPARLTQAGQLMIAVTMNGQPEEMLLDTGAPVSFVSDALVNALDLPVRPTGARTGGIDGSFDVRLARVAELRAGNAPSRNQDFLVMPTKAGRPAPAGLFGADYLRSYDVELDPAEGKVKLFSPGHCPNGGVYWDKAWYELPFRLADDLHIRLPVSVDGTTVRAVLDTGSPQTAIRLRVAERRLGVLRDQVKAGYIGPVSGTRGHGVDAYRHRFALIDLGGIQLKNWEVNLLDDAGGSAGWNGDEMLIGMDVLGRFRMMIDYGQSKIFFTQQPDQK